MKKQLVKAGEGKEERIGYESITLHAAPMRPECNPESSPSACQQALSQGILGGRTRHPLPATAYKPPLSTRSKPSNKPHTLLLLPPRPSKYRSDHPDTTKGFN